MSGLVSINRKNWRLFGSSLPMFTIALYTPHTDAALQRYKLLLMNLSLRLKQFLMLLGIVLIAACQPSSQETKQRENKIPVTEEIETPENLSTDQAVTLVEDIGFSSIEDETTVNLNPVIVGECFAEDNRKYAELTPVKACNFISNRLASVSQELCETARLQPTQCTSVDGFPILLSEFPPLEDRQQQGRILVLGGTHGDELTSVSIVFKWIEKLNKFHSGLFHWRIVPMVNPDGVLPRAAQRTNKNGVDLNRNLPSNDWHEKALKYWREKQGENPRRYPGEHPASEPETRWLIDEINDFQPDAIISVHAPFGMVDFDSLLLNAAPKSLGKLHLNLLGTYPGSLGNYAGINRNIPVITLELPHAWEMPKEAEITKIWEDIVAWLRKNINNEAQVQQ